MSTPGQHNPGTAHRQLRRQGRISQTGAACPAPHVQHDLQVDGEFGKLTETATKEFQKDTGLPVTGVVDRPTWDALPIGDPMPVLSQGSSGEVVRSLQEILTKGAFGLWETIPKGIDGNFGPNTAASVRGFQTWARIKVDGVVGQTDLGRCHAGVHGRAPVHHWRAAHYRPVAATVR